jgi:hypothetical protein
MTGGIERRGRAYTPGRRHPQQKSIKQKLEIWFVALAQNPFHSTKLVLWSN